jgi:UDP-N-acetylglucosamine 4-epimerase
VFNVACGDNISLNELVAKLRKISSQNEKGLIYASERIGDVKHSNASINKISNDLGYLPSVNFDKGLQIVYNWYLDQSKLTNCQ